MDEKFYTPLKKSSLEVYDWYDTPFEKTKRISPAVYDAIYLAAKKAQDKGKKIAIHCGAGDGRTGTALASLKLREILDDEYSKNNINFDNPPNMTEQIHTEFGGLKDGAGCNVNVTPFVKKAIEKIRSFDKPGHHSVESPNDVATLIMYERHLLNQLSLKHQNKTLMYPQIDFNKEMFLHNKVFVKMNNLARDCGADKNFLEALSNIDNTIQKLIQKSEDIAVSNPTKAAILRALWKK